MAASWRKGKKGLIELRRPDDSTFSQTNATGRDTIHLLQHTRAQRAGPLVAIVAGQNPTRQASSQSAGRLGACVKVSNRHRVRISLPPFIIPAQLLPSHIYLPR